MGGKKEITSIFIFIFIHDEQKHVSVKYLLLVNYYALLYFNSTFKILFCLEYYNQLIPYCECLVNTI